MFKSLIRSTRSFFLRALFVTLISWFYTLCLSAQSTAISPKPGLSSTQLKEDFALTRQILETIHPALYDFVSKEKLTQEFDNTDKLLNHDMSELEFFKLIAPIIFQLGCGHTAMGLPAKEDSYISRFLPVKLKFLGGKAFISAAEDANLRLVGAEIMEINKIPIGTIVNKLFRYISTDGISISNKYMWLDSKFDRYYGLHIAQPDSFNLVLKTKFNNDSIVSLAALTQRFTSKRDLGINEESKKHTLPFYLNLVNPKVAVLTIDKFYVNETFDEKVYTSFLDSCFNELKIKRVKNLIIDLRQNPGGYGTWGAWLYAYLTNRPFKYYAEAVVTTDENLPFLKYTDWKESEYLEYLKDVVKTSSGTYQWTAHANLKLQYPRKNNFAGSVYILIGRKSFSTTAEFCAIAHSNKRAIFVGEETGGGYYSINGGDMMEVVLPNSRIKMAVPMRKYLIAVNNYPYTGHGTIPGYWVGPTIEEFIEGTDVEMKFVLKLIDKKRGN